MVRKHRGIISVCSRKLITSVSSTLTSAPMTPRLVSRRYSKGLVLLVVFKNGYRYRGIWAEKNKRKWEREMEFFTETKTRAKRFFSVLFSYED
jgi:hypothetical protein